MKAAIGGSLLLNIVVIFTTIIILFFVGILAYSKAYKIKNRIIEVIEKNNGYSTAIANVQLAEDLQRAGYWVATKAKVSSKCTEGANLNGTEYLYCVYENPSNEGKTYKVVTYIRFEFPVIGDVLTFAVRGETKVLGKEYDY